MTSTIEGWRRRWYEILRWAEVCGALDSIDDDMLLQLMNEWHKTYIGGYWNLKLWRHCGGGDHTSIFDCFSKWCLATYNTASSVLEKISIFSVAAEGREGASERASARACVVLLFRCLILPPKQLAESGGFSDFDIVHVCWSPVKKARVQIEGAAASELQ